MPEPTQTPTPEKTPKQESRPPPPNRVDSEVSTTEMDEDTGYESRSRSQSRRRRRQNQRQRQAQGKAQTGNVQAESMASVPEIEEAEEPPKQQLKNPAAADTTEMQPFDRIRPPSESMNGPVTYARAMRGEIPMRGKAPSQPLETTQGVDAKGGGNMMEQDGLKLRIELNLDIEIELKASIHGDLTLALLA